MRNKKLVEFTGRIFDKGFTELSDIPFNKPSFMIKQIPALLGLKSYKSVYSLVSSSYIKSEKLRRMLSMHPLLVGGNPFTTTSIYGLILYLRKKWGIHYSMGGTGQIIKGLERLMTEEGIKIIKNSEVTKLITKNNKIMSVETNSGDNIDADNVVCNADPPGVYENLINVKHNLMFKWKKVEWIILWVFSSIILVQKKSMMMWHIIQLNLVKNIKNILMIFLKEKN